ncbi:MAG: hypothetical protein AAFX87_15930 [Bacteroidota bacterium]
MSKEKKKKKFDWRNLVLMGFSIAFTIAILEIFLRIFMASDQKLLHKDYQTNQFLVPNKYWKVWHYADSKTTHTRDCFEADYSTNEYGMKDGPVNFSLPKITLLGDSYVEGHGKNNNQSVSHFMDSLLEQQYEVLNFGTSGGIGTVHQLALYDNFASHFDAELVILFFLNYNDLYDNINAISEGFINEDLEFTYPKANDFEEIKTFIADKGTPPEVQYSKGGLYTFKLARRGFSSLGAYFQTAANVKLFDFRTAIAKMYDPDESDDIRKGYNIFEKSLTELKKQVEADSAQLLLVQIADPFQIDVNWLDLSAGKIDKTLQPDYPNTRVKAICDSLGVAYFDMYPQTADYIKTNEMTFPYFFHTCDRHYDTHGNRWMAELVVGHLREKNLVKQ